MVYFHSHAKSSSKAIIKGAESGTVDNYPPAKNDCQKTFVTFSEYKWAWPMNMDMIAIRDGCKRQLLGGVGS